MENQGLLHEKKQESFLMMNPEFYDKQLRTFPLEQKTSLQDDIPLLGSLPELFRSFEQMTGYCLRFVRTGGTLPTENEQIRILTQRLIRNAKGRALGTLVLWQTIPSDPKVSEELARSSADAVAATVEEVYTWATSLREREAELGALTNHFYLNEEKKLQCDSIVAFCSDHLYKILKKIGGILDCQASALYLLDEKTSCLKLRSAWGIPEEQFNAPPRPLKGALADLEALLGNAVILNESYLSELWQAPEDFTTSICIPIVSQAAVLGTLWLFSDQKIEFTTRELNILEMVADQIVLELEATAIKIVSRQ